MKRSKSFSIPFNICQNIRKVAERQKILGIGYILIWALLVFPTTVQAQQYDLLLKGGHVIDPKNGVDNLADVAIKDGKIANISQNISETDGQSVVDVSGKFVTPGLIDIHSHNFHGTDPNTYLSNGLSALPPDGFTFRSGVTTAVDVGGAGWKNFQQFKEQVINQSRTRILSFINIIGDGMSGLPEQSLNNMDPKLTGLAARRNPEIVGVKIAHYSGHDWEPYRRAVEAGEYAEIPVMVDFGNADPHLPLEELFLDVLRPGDIFTHMYGGNAGGYSGRQSIIDLEGKLRSRMTEAQRKGIIFDVGFGGGSFFYDVAVPATEQDFWPNTISTDIHTGSMNGGMKTMLNVVSTLMNLGMSLQDAIEASTWKPAQVIQREDLGHLSEGSEADIAVFSLINGEFGFMDSRRNALSGSQKLETELTLRAGNVVWDLNGIAATQWEE